MTQLSPKPSEAEHQRFHDLDLQSKAILGVTKLEAVIKRTTWVTARCVKFVSERVGPRARLLDVGSGYGTLLGELAKGRYRIVGLEPSEVRREVSHA